MLVRAAAAILLVAFSVGAVVGAAAGGWRHAVAVGQSREVVVTDVSCLEGFRGSSCVLRWVNDAGEQLSAGLAGAEGVDGGDVVTIAPEDPAAAPDDWAERPEAATTGGPGPVMLLGPTALFGDVLLPLVLAAGCAIAAAATWGRWADGPTDRPADGGAL